MAWWVSRWGDRLWRSWGTLAWLVGPVCTGGRPSVQTPPADALVSHGCPDIVMRRGPLQLTHSCHRVLRCRACSCACGGTGSAPASCWATRSTTKCPAGSWDVSGAHVTVTRGGVGKESRFATRSYGRGLYYLCVTTMLQSAVTRVCQGALSCGLLPKRSRFRSWQAPRSERARLQNCTRCEDPAQPPSTRL